MPRRLPARGRPGRQGHRIPAYPVGVSEQIRLTQYAAGGGCACKLAPGVLEELTTGLRGQSARYRHVLIGVDDGDDAAVVTLASNPELAVVSTTDFFTPVVDRARDWGRIAAANALSDVYAMGGTPLVALNLVGWPVDVLPLSLLEETLAGAAEIADRAGCPLGGGHSIAAPEPVFGLAVTGLVNPARMLRNNAARPGLPLTLTKPLGLGVLNNRHKQTGQWFPEAVALMCELNDTAARQAVAAGLTAATDVTGFGLLGHLAKMCRASGVDAVIDHRTVPYLADTRPSLAAGYVPGGSLRNLEWVRRWLAVADGVDRDELVLLADAQTSGGLLVAGEIPGGQVIGQLVARPGDGRPDAGPVITIR